MPKKAQYITDGYGYRGTDSGCRIASKYLGHPSKCTKCPFPECVFMLPTRKLSVLTEKRNTEIKRLAKEGVEPKEIAAMFSVSIRTIQRVLGKP